MLLVSLTSGLVFVEEGKTVKVGAPLAQIDPERQAQTLHTTESTRAAREADVTYWKSQVERLQALLKAGAISQNEFDTARQVREGRVQLDYYRVVAPTAGVIGDVPVREGDRVTTSTVLTTIDDKAGLEAYIEVPVDRAPDLRVGLPVQLLDQDGKVMATNPLTFVAPRVDPATQTVLAKSRLHDAPPSVRVQQFVRTRIIWAGPDRAPAPRAGRRGPGQQLHREGRTEGRRSAHRVGHPEDRRRRTGEGGVAGRTVCS